MRVSFVPKLTPEQYSRVKTIIGFTDSRGRRWRRTGIADPEQVTENDTFVTGGPDWYRVESG